MANPEFVAVFEAAEQARQKHLPKKAIKLYLQAKALASSSEEELKSSHMLGVAYGMDHDYDAAINELRDALRLAEATEAKGNVWRDLARQYWGLKKFPQAKACINHALPLLLEVSNIEAYGATLGFYGRSLCEEGDLVSGIAWLKAADNILAATSNRAFELYNLLDLGDYLNQAGHREEAKAAARRAKALARVHGGSPHILRAMRVIKSILNLVA